MWALNPRFAVLLGVITQFGVGQDALLVSIREEYVDGVEVNITHLVYCIVSRVLALQY